MFDDREYLIHRKVFRFFGGAFHLYDAQGRMAAYCEMKAFKLKEDLRVYGDESRSDELFAIRARSILDFGATYDVIDPVTSQPFGALRRRGFKSMIRDEWLMLGEDDREIGVIQEDSQLMALVRRFLSNLIPQTYHCRVGEAQALTLKQNFNPFVMKIRLIFEQWPDDLDRRLAVAAGILLCAIEGRQTS